MPSGRYRFGRFALDPANRHLCRGGEPVELGGRYLDALVLLVAESGRLVSKERFHQEVWHGIPVTDEALTQCIRTLRRQLGDDAGAPTFIETVPKHGYRFVAPVDWEDATPGALPPAGAPPAPPMAASWPLSQALRLGLAGTVGGGLAGALGGLFYGLLLTAQPAAPGVGAASVLLVLLAVTTGVGLVGGAGVAFGMAAARLASGRMDLWAVPGAALGGLLVGGAAKLLGIDAFNLLLGQAPSGITGAGEGALLGAGVGLGGWLVLRRSQPLARGLALAAIAGAFAGGLVAAAGGRLMAGSLDRLAGAMPASRLRPARIGALLGEDGFGPLSQLVTAALEGALFAAGVVGALLLARRWSAPPGSGMRAW